jgi:hypothetical protein
MGVAGEIINMYGADGPLGPSDIVRRELDTQLFTEAIADDLAKRVAHHGLVAGFRRRGVLAARVVVTATCESPVRQNKENGQLSFLGMNAVARGQAARIATFFEQVSEVSENTSRNPFARKARLRIIKAEPTGYRYMDEKLRPGRWTKPRFLNAFEEGYMEEADRYGLGIKDSRQGLAIVMEAPKKIRGVDLGAVTWEIDKEEPDTSTSDNRLAALKAWRPSWLKPSVEIPSLATAQLRDSGTPEKHSFLTENGVVLSLVNETANGIPLGYRLPRTADSLMESARIRNVTILPNNTLPCVFELLLSNIANKAGVDF